MCVCVGGVSGQKMESLRGYVLCVKLWRARTVDDVDGVAGLWVVVTVHGSYQPEQLTAGKEGGREAHSTAQHSIPFNIDTAVISYLALVHQQAFLQLLGPHWAPCCCLPLPSCTYTNAACSRRSKEDYNTLLLLLLLPGST